MARPEMASELCQFQSPWGRMRRIRRVARTRADDASEQQLTPAAVAVTPDPVSLQCHTVDGAEEELRSSSRASDGTGGSPAGMADAASTAL